MQYKSKLHEWMRKAAVLEQEKIAKDAGVKVHYLQRLATGKVPDPGLFTCRRIVRAIADYNVMFPDDRLPLVELRDIREPEKCS